MKIAVSFSGGKDSMLTLHEMVEAGHTPVALLVMYRREAGRSWTHGIDDKLLTAVGEALGIPLLCWDTGESTYEQDMENALRRAKAMGAEGCAFGDIDVPLHRKWDEDRCAAVGMEPLLPLWQRDRRAAVEKTLDLGYRCLIKCLRRDILPEEMLGRPLSRELVERIAALGADPCGENGEYHTVVTAGPLFRHPVETVCRGLVRMDQVTAADIALAE